MINDPQSTLGLAVAACLESEKDSDENPTDESGSDSDGAESTSSSYSSLSDFVFDIQNSDITGDVAGGYRCALYSMVNESCNVFQSSPTKKNPDFSAFFFLIFSSDLQGKRLIFLFSR